MRLLAKYWIGFVIVCVVTAAADSTRLFTIKWWIAEVAVVTLLLAYFSAFDRLYPAGQKR